jgi:triphosphatase
MLLHFDLAASRIILFENSSACVGVMKHESRELELKVELSEPDVARLLSALPADEGAPGSVSPQKLRTVYFDTPEYDLRAAGISLRVRWQGEVRLQTIKAERRLTNGLSDAVEHECAIQNNEPDLAKIGDRKLRRMLQKLSKESALRPVFESVVQRITRQFTIDGSEIELAIDEGEVRANGSSRGFREAELELKSGNASGLLAAAEILFAGQELKLSTKTKADRGYQLALGKSRSSTEPQPVQQPNLKRKDSCAQAFATILSSAIQQIAVNRQAVLETDDPRGVHQLRIGLRRLRCALRALRPLIASSSLREFERLAREIARSIGPLRDADVLINAIVAPVEAMTGDGFSELYDALARNRQRKRDEARASLRGASWTHMQLYLTLWPSTLAEADGSDQPIAVYAREIMEKTWRKTSKYGRKLDKLSVESRHEMRKLLKELRYLAEFFMPVFKARQTRRFLKELKVLLDLFGYVNDVRVTDQLRSLQEQQPVNAQLGFSAGYVCGWHEATARQRWRGTQDAWDSLRSSPRFWT